MTYLLETYGCQMNKAESAAMESVLREKGWTACADERPDLVLINTCSVRATAENRAWGRLAHHAAAKRQRPFAIAVTGCMAEQQRAIIRERIPEIDYVLGTFQKQAFGQVLDAAVRHLRLDEIEETPAFVFASSHHEPGSFRSFLPIMHGCDNFCSYCIVPYLRGRETSRSPSSILAELDALEDSGVREVTLLGQNVNSYRWEGPEGKLDFPGLLRLVAGHLRSRRDAARRAADDAARRAADDAARRAADGAAHEAESGADPAADKDDGSSAGAAGNPTGRPGKGIGWIRFLTSHPKDLSDEVIRVMAEEPIFCRHVHLCVQSGSDRVLQAMNRKYTRAWYLDLAERMKASIPGLSLSTDILVGFPGETEEDLEATLDLMKRVGYVYSFMYHYNPREGTPAAVMPGRISEKVKRDRLARVIGLQKKITGALMAARVGAVDDVLIEGPSRRSRKEVLARTQRDEMVVFPGDPSRAGDFARVRLVGLSGNTFRAEEVDVS